MPRRKKQEATDGSSTEIKATRSSRRGNRNNETSEASTATAAAGASNAWADFLQDASTSNDNKGEEPASTAAAAATMSAMLKDGGDSDSYTYDLSLAESNNSDGGCLAQCGTLDATAPGRKNISLSDLENASYHFTIPTILMPTISVKTVITAGHSAHALCIDIDNNCYGWGRNEQGQLAQAASKCVPLPTLIRSNVYDAAVGKSHSIFIDSDSRKLFAVGSNKCGQCGWKANVTSSATVKPCVVGGDDMEFRQVSCGEEFTLALTKEGHLYSSGLSQFGQLGNGETGEYFISASKLAFANSHGFVDRRTKFICEGEKEIPDILLQTIECGKHHSLALEAPRINSTTQQPIPPRVFSWGCGDYGCLGHGQQKDDYSPRQITTLPKGLFISKLSAGSNCSMVLTAANQSSFAAGHVYYWGKHRSNMEAVMRPAVVDALSNNRHVVTCLGAGYQIVVCSTKNNATVVWGQGGYGELGLGSEKKSSSQPTFIDKLSNLTVLDLACGAGFTLFVVKKDEGEGDEKPKKGNRSRKRKSSSQPPVPLPVAEVEAIEAALQHVASPIEVVSSTTKATANKRKR